MYKVGDFVRVSSNLRVGRHDGINIIDDMAFMFGKVGEIVRVSGQSGDGQMVTCYHLNLKFDRYWPASTLEYYIDFQEEIV